MGLFFLFQSCSKRGLGQFEAVELIVSFVLLRLSQSSTPGFAVGQQVIIRQLLDTMTRITSGQRGFIAKL